VKEMTTAPRVMLCPPSKGLMLLSTGPLQAIPPLNQIQILTMIPDFRGLG
jgi:hypothetical protein